MVNFSVGFSKEVRKQCLENNIMFFDTGYNQREVLDEIYKKIQLMNGDEQNDR